MTLNAYKCEVAFFTTNSHKANLKASNGNSILLHNTQPKSLGVILNNQLTFSTHI